LRAIRPEPPVRPRVSVDIGALLYDQPRPAPRRFHVMANIHSQKKRILRTERERLENRHYTSAIRTYFHRLEAAVAAGDDALADAELKTLLSTIDKAVKRGALHRNNGAHKKSRATRVRRAAAA